VTPAVHGHRGARAVLPENTLAGFVYAIEAGADYIELDVQATVDDVLVVAHDPILSRLRYVSPGGSRMIRGLTCAELREWDCGSRRNRRFPRQLRVPGAHIPTLDEVFSLSRRTPVQFDVEIKSFPDRPWLAPPPERFALLVLEAVERHRLDQRVVVQSFDHRVLVQLHRLAPGLRLAALSEFAAGDFVSTARDACASIVAPYHRFVTRRKVEAAHAAGLRVVPWTANRPGSWARLIRTGVDGIITDDPAGLIDYLRAVRTAAAHQFGPRHLQSP
jgi:glycerophosphoryl diester phosphodiesterase